MLGTEDPHPQGGLRRGDHGGAPATGVSMSKAKRRKTIYKRPCPRVQNAIMSMRGTKRQTHIICSTLVTGTNNKPATGN